MATLPLKSSHIFCYLFAVGKQMWRECHSVWDASSIWWQVFYETSNTFLAWKVCSWSRKSCWWGRTWSPCCFDDRCNDHSGRFPHAVKPACDGINVYMNLDDTLKNETLILTFKHNCLLDLFTFLVLLAMLFNTCELQQKTAGQKTALTDCLLSTSDVTVMTSSS